MVVYQPDHRRRRVVLVMLVLTALALISFDERGSATIDSARSSAADVIQPVRDLASNTFNPVTDWLDGLGRASELQGENDRLRRELAQAKADAAAGASARAQLKVLLALYDLPQVEDYDGVVADVTGQSTGFDRTFTIDKGSDAGIEQGMPVVVEGGALVGKVYTVFKSAAIVQRIDDRQFGVNAQLVDKDQFGPVGTAQGQIDSRNLVFAVIEGAAGVGMKKGEIAITNGRDGSAYPRGLPIGTVARDVTPGGSVARNAELKPIVDLDSLVEVKVLRYRPQAAP